MVALVEEWSGWRHEYPVERSMLLVHGTNGDVDTVNLLAQGDRLAAGELGPRSIRAPDREYDLHEATRSCSAAHHCACRPAAGSRTELRCGSSTLTSHAAD